MEESRKAYFMLQTEVDKNGNYIPCIAIENESGYYRTDWQWGDDWEMANQICDDKNASLGLSLRDAMLIQLSTMRF